VSNRGSWDFIRRQRDHEQLDLLAKEGNHARAKSAWNLFEFLTRQEPPGDPPVPAEESSSQLSLTARNPLSPEIKIRFEFTFWGLPAAFFLGSEQGEL
jgi:hypothetical protein